MQLRCHSRGALLFLAKSYNLYARRPCVGEVTDNAPRGVQMEPLGTASRKRCDFRTPLIRTRRVAARR